MKTDQVPTKKCPKPKHRNVYVKRFGVVEETSVSYLYNRSLVYSAQVANVCREVLKIDTYSSEVFIVVAVDKKLIINGVTIVTQGVLDSTLVHPREIFQAAIMHNAHGIFVAHNHPSGDPTPSQEDFDVTNRLIKAGDVVGIQVIDHIIIGSEKHSPPHFSIRDTQKVRFIG